MMWSLAIAQDDAEVSAENSVEEKITTEVPAPEPACFSVRDINNFDALGDRFVYVEGRRNQHYLLTMQRACFGLRSANGIAISNTIDRVCSNSFADITYREFGTIESCTIREVESVADKAAAEAIAERRRNQE
jgi:hypothetical protein